MLIYIYVEGSFALVASVVITFMAINMIKVQEWRDKWEKKLEESTEDQLNKHKKGSRWALILLSFSVVCRESLETLLFIGGVSDYYIIHHYRHHKLIN